MHIIVLNYVYIGLNSINNIFSFLMNRERNERIFIHDCDMHEYGYLGSPLFNLRGHLVGITFLDKGHLQAWTVLELQDVVLKNTKR